MPNRVEGAKVVAVNKSQTHTFTKATCDAITLLAGLGVEGDAHMGEMVKHRSRVKADPTQPNLRQVHLIHKELLDTLKAQGFRVDPGVVGENITTTGIDLLAMPRGTLLHIGANAIVKITGLRNPCLQLNAYQQGLQDAVLERTSSGELIRKSGIMSVVIKGGIVKPGDTIAAVFPETPHDALLPV